MPDLTGQSIGRYNILERLGEGGMATVYMAYDTRLERNVALKVIRLEKTADPHFLKRFEREAKALAQLEHPNIFCDKCKRGNYFSRQKNGWFLPIMVL
jgi:serine/threonine protein kinase